MGPFTQALNTQFIDCSCSECFFFFYCWCQIRGEGLSYCQKSWMRALDVRLVFPLENNVFAKTDNFCFMALPNSQQSVRSNEDNPPLASQPKQTYANALKQTTTRQSLIHCGPTPVSTPDPTVTRVIESRIYRSSRTKGALIFDTTECLTKYTEQDSMVVIKTQHPNCHSCTSLKDGSRSYMEVYIDHDDDTNNIVNSGLNFPKCNLNVLPCTAVDDTAQIITVTLSHLPMMKKEKVLKGLTSSLAPFGKIFDVGIFVDTATRLFMGRGYAVLDVSAGREDKAYHPLTHVISWKDMDNEIIRATWKNMPTWCRYCHQEGHAISECALATAGLICYNCNERGHRSKECPSKEIRRNRNKRQKNGAVKPQIPSSSPPSQPSAELLKSKYASDNVSHPASPTTETNQHPENAPSAGKGDDTDDDEDLDFQPPDVTDSEDLNDADVNSVLTEDMDQELAQLCADNQLQLDTQQPTAPLRPQSIHASTRDYNQNNRDTTNMSLMVAHMNRNPSLLEPGNGSATSQLDPRSN